MRTLLNNLDYSAVWTPTGKWRDGRPEYKKCFTQNVPSGNSTLSFDGNYQTYAVGSETYLNRNDGYYLWGWQFNDGTNKFIGYINNTDRVVNITCSATGTGNFVIYGW